MKNKWLYGCALITLALLCLPVTAWAAENPVGVSYRGHIQDLGDYPRDGSWVDSPEIIGTTGQSKRIEGFEIKLTGTVPEGMELRYNVHVQNKGWLDDENDSTNWPKDGAYAGTRGESLRIEAVKIVLTDRDGKAVPGYSVEYRGHVQNVGDLPKAADQWLADGEQLGTVGSSQRLEALLVQVVKTAVEPPAPVPVVYDKAGTYGPVQGSETITGDVTIAADGVILQNLVINGNLTISEAVGDGTVTLNNVTVKGDTVVRGGGVNSIKINGGKYSRIVMEQTASGAVRIVAIGVDGLPVIISEAAAGETIILEGAFESVTVDAPNMSVTTQGATTTIGKLTVGAGAGGSTVTVAAGTTVNDLLLNGKAAVKGQGNVAKAEVKADGVVFEKKPGSYSVEPGVVIPPVFPTPDSGGGYTPPTPIAVSGVSLNKMALTLSFNTSETLVAAVAPSGATNQAVTWTSSDDTIATVDATGKVTGTTKEGSATITVTTADGAKSASCTVTVTSFKLKIAADGTGIIAGINGSSTDIVIPETIGGLTITAIGDNAFKGSGIEKASISKTVKAIGASAFASCNLLRSVTFKPDSSLETIGNSAFYHSAIEEALIPKTVKIIGDNAFNNCIQLKLVTFEPESSLDTIGTAAFAGSGVWNITLPEKVKAIPDLAFAGCGALSSVTLPSGLTAIGAEAFKNCSQLTDITIPKSVISIGKDVFGFDANKTPTSRSYTFRGDVPSTMGAVAANINPGAVIPTTPTPTIRYYENYTGFTTVDWAGYTKAVILAQPVLNTPTATNTGTPVVELEWQAVPGASSYDVYVREYPGYFTDVTLNVKTGTTAEITSGLFSGNKYEFAVKALDAAGESLLSEVKSVAVPYPVPVTDLAIAASPPEIPMGSTGLLSATITPANATNQKVFWSSFDPTIATVDGETGVITTVSPGFAKMRGITADGNFTKTCTVRVKSVLVESVILDKETLTVGVTKTAQLNATVLPINATHKTLTWSTTAADVATVDATGKVTGVKEGLATITATTQDGKKTATCAVSVTVPTPIRAEAITAVAEPFVGLTPTTSFAVMLPDNTTHEYSGSVAWTETGTTMPVTTFDGSKAYTATLTLTAEPGYQFAAGTAFSVAGADSVATTIGEYGLTATVTANYAVKDRYELTSQGVITAYSGPGGELVVPGTIDETTVVGINSSAFFANVSLTKVTLPDTIQSLSGISFDACMNLQAINIPKDLTSIPAYCFFSCSKLETVIIPSEASLQTIDEYAFAGTKLKTMTIPATVTAIEDNAFENCNQLTTVTFTANSQLKTIGENAFNSCALTELSLPATVTAIGQKAFIANKLTKLMLNNSDGTTLTIGRDAFQGSLQDTSENPITEITLPAGVSLPVDTQADIATMGLYGEAFKSFYENTAAGGTFVYNTTTNQWSKKP